MTTLSIEYKSSVKTAAGWRSVHIIAEAEPLTLKAARVVRVLSIDGEEPGFNMSRTGAKRQQFNGNYFANAEVGKRKLLGSCTVLAN